VTLKEKIDKAHTEIMADIHSVAPGLYSHETVDKLAFQVAAFQVQQDMSKVTNESEVE